MAENNYQVADPAMPERRSPSAPPLPGNKPKVSYAANPIVQSMSSSSSYQPPPLPPKPKSFYPTVPASSTASSASPARPAASFVAAKPLPAAKPIPVAQVLRPPYGSAAQPAYSTGAPPSSFTSGAPAAYPVGSASTYSAPRPGPPAKPVASTGGGNRGRPVWVSLLCLLIGLAVLGGVIAAIVYYVVIAPANLANSVATNAPTRTPSISGPSGPPTTRSPTRNPAVAFNIEVRYASSISSTDREAFERARQRWEAVITTDFASVAVIPRNSDLSGCNQPSNSQDIVIDDIVIFAIVEPIDGVLGTLGEAGPCGMANGQIRVGFMRFDSADTADMAAKGILEDVVLHEMGHVLGLGTRWDPLGLITPGSTNIRYKGTGGNSGHVDVGGVGQAVIEDRGGPGTARGHWHDVVYGDELMTGFVSGDMAMSRMTVGALSDLGYTVDLAKADPYTVPPPSPSGRRLRNTQERVSLGNDILDLPLMDMNISIAKPGREAEHSAYLEAYQAKLEEVKVAANNEGQE